MPPGVNVTTTTNVYLAPFWVDLILRDNYFFGKMMQKTKKWKGSQMNFPIKYQKGVASVAFNGFDLLPVTQNPVSVNMTFYPTFIATNVALAGSELSINQAEGNGSLQTLNLMKVIMESRSQDASDDVGNFLQGDGTSFGGKAPNGLLNTVDNGTVAATYGGLSRSTYTGLNATVTAASGGTISLLKVRTLWNAISDGPVQPDFIITDYTTWGYFEALQTPFQRNNQDFAPAMRTVAQVSGYSEQRWDGMIISRDKKVTTGYFYMLNLKYLEWHALKWWEGQAVSAKAKDIEGNVYEDRIYTPGNAFTWTGMIRSFNQGVVNGFMILGGQLICLAPFRQGVLTGITGY